MAEEKDRIELIRARRGQNNVADRNQVGGAQVGRADNELEPHLMLNIQHPWHARDRVTLSLDAQISMIQQRANYRANMIDTGYTNRISHVAVKPGVHCLQVSYGYQRVYHIR